MNHMRLHAAGAHAQTPLDCALLPQQADGDLAEVLVLAGSLRLLWSEAGDEDFRERTVELSPGETLTLEL